MPERVDCVSVLMVFGPPIEGRIRNRLRYRSYLASISSLHITRDSARIFQFGSAQINFFEPFSAVEVDHFRKLKISIRSLTYYQFLRCDIGNMPLQLMLDILTTRRYIKPPPATMRPMRST